MIFESEGERIEREKCDKLEAQLTGLKSQARSMGVPDEIINGMSEDDYIEQAKYKIGNIKKDKREVVK